MRNEEKLYLAIGDVDESLIEEASAPYKKQKMPAKKIIAIAASAAIVSVAVIGTAGLLNMGLGNMKGDSNYAPEDFGGDMNESAPNDNVLISDIGRLELIENEGESFTFILEIYAPTSLPIDVYLYSKDKSAVYTTAQSAEAAEIYRPRVTVDGEAAERLPGEVGEYTVTISFDGIHEKDIDWQYFFTVDNFGPIKHGNFQ